MKTAILAIVFALAFALASAFVLPSAFAASKDKCSIHIRETKVYQRYVQGANNFDQTTPYLLATLKDNGFKIENVDYRARYHLYSEVRCEVGLMGCKTTLEIYDFEDEKTVYEEGPSRARFGSNADFSAFDLPKCSELK